MFAGMPLVVVFICYFAIYQYVRKVHTSLQQVMTGNHRKANILPVKKEDMQLAITLFATFVIFMVLWTPYMVTAAVDMAYLWPKDLYVITLAMGHANSVFNCFTYGVCNPNFRRGYYVFLQRLFRRNVNNMSSYTDNSREARKDNSTIPTVSK